MVEPVIKIQIEADAQQVPKSFDEVRKSLKELDSATADYRKQVLDLQSAQRRGLISAERARAALSGIEKEYIDAADAAARLAGASATVSSGNEKFSISTLLASNRARGLTQQLSQVAQQSVATGQVAQAFAVQAADIGLAFGTVGTVVGALAGIALPTLISAMSNTSGETDILESELEQLADAAELADAVLNRLRLSADELVKTYGEGHETVRLFSIAQAELAAGQIERRLRDQIGLVRTLSDEYTRATRGTIGNIAAIRRDFGVTTEQAKLLRSELVQLGNADTFEKQQQELGDILTLLQEMDVDLSKIPPDLNLALNEMINLGIETERVRTLMGELRAEAAGVTVGVPLFEQALGPGGLLPPPPSTRTGGGGSRRDPNQSRIDSLINSLKTERELVEEFYTEGLELLKLAGEEELEVLGGLNEAKLRLEEEYQERLRGIKKEGAAADLALALGSGADVLSALGAFNDKALRLAQVFGAAQALISAYQGAAEALKLPFPANIAAASQVLATGLGFVSAIKGVSSSGGTSGGGAGAAVASATPAAAATPLQANVTGFSPDSLFTGSQVTSLFDMLQAEAGDRGLSLSFST